MGGELWTIHQSVHHVVMELFRSSSFTPHSIQMFRFAVLWFSQKEGHANSFPKHLALLYTDTGPAESIVRYLGQPRDNSSSLGVTLLALVLTCNDCRRRRCPIGSPPQLPGARVQGVEHYYYRHCY